MWKLPGGLDLLRPGAGKCCAGKGWGRGKASGAVPQDTGAGSRACSCGCASGCGGRDSGGGSGGRDADGQERGGGVQESDVDVDRMLSGT